MDQRRRKLVREFTPNALKLSTDLVAGGPIDRESLQSLLYAMMRISEGIHAVAPVESTALIAEAEEAFRRARAQLD